MKCGRGRRINDMDCATGILIIVRKALQGRLQIQQHTRFLFCGAPQVVQRGVDHGIHFSNVARKAKRVSGVRKSWDTAATNRSRSLSWRQISAASG